MLVLLISRHADIFENYQKAIDAINIHEISHVSDWCIVVICYLLIFKYYIFIEMMVGRLAQ